MLPKSLRSLKRLAQLATSSQQAIEQQLATTHRSAPPGRAWGQFLDAAPNENQIGIYGTTAGIRILSRSDSSGYVDLVNKALTTLPGIGLQTGIFDPADLNLTYKASAILAAAQPGQQKFTATEPVETMLLAACIDGHGWGHHFWPGDPDLIPRILPTSHALIALARSNSFINSALAVTVLEWLMTELRNTISAPAYEQAFGLIALQLHEGRAKGIVRFEDTIRTVTHRLENWARNRSTVFVSYDEHLHYWVPESTKGHNHYGFYPPDIIVTWALLMCGNPKATRSYVLRVIKAACDEVTTRRQFRSEATHRSGATDALWVHEMLIAFKECVAAKPLELLPTLYSATGATFFRKSVASFVAVVVSVGSGYVVAANDHGPWVTGTAAVIGSVATGLAVNLWYSWSNRSP